MDNLKKLKTLLAIKNDGQDDLLNLILDQTTSALEFKLSNDDVPKELNYILIEVAIKRFNRIRNEGMTSYSQEGESITFNSNDFDDFADDIAKWRAENSKDDTSLGTFYFINPYERRGK